MEKLLKKGSKYKPIPNVLVFFSIGNAIINEMSFILLMMKSSYLNFILKETGKGLRINTFFIWNSSLKIFLGVGIFTRFLNNNLKNLKNSLIRSNFHFIIA